MSKPASRKPVASLAERGHKDEANDHAKHATNQETATKGRSGGRRMSGAILAISALACCISFAIAAIYWGRGGYANVKIAFPWVVVSAVFFLVAAVSAFWCYVVSPAKNAPSGRAHPYITVTSATLHDLGVGQKPRVVIEYTASGGAVRHVEINSRITLTNIAEWQPDYRDTVPIKIEPIIAPNTKMYSTVFASWETTQKRLDQVNSGEFSIYAYGIITYTDEDGHALPPYGYSFRYDQRIGAFAFYTPPKAVAEIKDILTFPKTANVPDNRPRIDIASIAVADVTVDGHPRYAVNFRNVSLIKPALGANCKSFVAFSYIRMTDDPKLPQSSILPGETVDLEPKEVRTVTGTANFTLDPSEMAAIKKKTGWLYVFGWIDYADEKGAPYKTKFCAWFDPDAGRIALCDAHNSAD